jgi:hypothetical protein
LSNGRGFAGRSLAEFGVARGKAFASRFASRDRTDPFPASLDEATMWIKSKAGLFNSTAYRSIVAEHFQPEGPGDKPMSVVVGHFLGRKKRDTGANTESDPFDVIAYFKDA